MSPSRPLLAVASVALLASAVAGCGDAGGLRGAGATPTAISPARLWPQLTPASSPAWDIEEADTETIKGVAVPGGDIREVDPTAIVRAEIDANPDDYEGDEAPYRDTARGMAHCAEEGTGATDGTGAPDSPGATDGGGASASRCPVLQPYYRDLTGDGRPDLTLGFRMLPGDLTAIRVYTVDQHRLLRVMAWEDAVSAVELAGRSVIIRSPSDLAEYEYRLQWTWDPERKAMLLTHDEMLRSDGRRHGPGTTGAPGNTPGKPLPSSSASGR
ncbi:hypothetical protein [Streptomyces canus]|uniref:hypothetical protein n=1 Tax=Streptomyces canus TaxID=58343 RepID=UPI003CE72F68